LFRGLVGSEMCIRDRFAPKFKEGNALKKTIQLPIDWEVDAKLLQAMIKASLAKIKD
jgi:uncharacterized protein YdhG (YjbR/CyaY superfamily)